MSHNTFGHLFRVTTWGESHGPALGCVVDGCPPGIPLRRPTSSPGSTSAGLARSSSPPSGRRPTRSRSCPGCLRGPGYDRHADLAVDPQHRPALEGLWRDRAGFRPGHADFTYHLKYGIRDYRGGGRSSARETAARVAAGGVARGCCRRCCRSDPRRAGADGRPAIDRSAGIGTRCRRTLLVP